MAKKKIIVASFERRAYPNADFICDGVNDEVEIQAAINLATQLKTKVRFLKGTYYISNPIILPEDSDA
jgi:hypothetical protein